MQPLSFLLQSNSSGRTDYETYRSVPNVIRMDGLFRRIEGMARRLTNLDCHVSPTTIQLIPTDPEGLAVSVDKTDGYQTLCIGSWYAELDQDAVVFELVEQAMRGQLRLRLEGDGTNFHTHTVEVRSNGNEWREVGRMAGCWFRKKPTRVVKYLRNEVTTLM